MKKRSDSLSRNQIWMVIAIAAIASIIVSGGTMLAINDNVSLAPKGGPEAYIKNAHQCNADGICETNSIEIGEVAPVAQPYGSLFAQNVISAGQKISAPSGTFNSLTVDDGSLFVEEEICLGDDCVETLGRDCAVKTISQFEGGDERCQEVGYEYCLMAEYDRTLTYYDSVNNECSGNIQLSVVSKVLGNCPTGNSGGGGGSCDSNDNGVEPTYGDQSISTGGTPKKVVCCGNLLSEPYCGDGFCDEEETSLDCPQDCGSGGDNNNTNSSGGGGGGGSGSR